MAEFDRRGVLLTQLHRRPFSRELFGGRYVLFGGRVSQLQFSAENVDSSPFGSRRNHVSLARFGVCRLGSSGVVVDLQTRGFRRTDRLRARPVSVSIGSVVVAD